MHQFRTWLRTRGYSASTIKNYCHYTRKAEAFLESLPRATTENLEEFLASLPPGPSTQRGARKALNAYYAFRGGKNPAADLVVPPEPHRLPRPLLEEDYAAYIYAADRLGGAHAVIGNVLAYTGCRFSELRFARWDQFNLKSREPHWRIIGKGSGRRGTKERVIPLHPALVATLRAWRATSPRGEYLISGARNPWATENTIRDLHRDIVETIGIAGTVPHQLRHTVITLSLDRTRDAVAVRDFAGHTSLATTQQYAGLLPGRLRAVSDSLG